MPDDDINQEREAPTTPSDGGDVGGAEQEMEQVEAKLPKVDLKDLVTFVTDVRQQGSDEVLSPPAAYAAQHVNESMMQMRPHDADDVCKMPSASYIMFFVHPLLPDNLVPHQVIQLPVTRTSEKVQRAMRAQGARAAQGQVGGTTLNPSLDEYLAAVGRYYGKVILIQYPDKHGKPPARFSCDYPAVLWMV